MTCPSLSADPRLAATRPGLARVAGRLARLIVVSPATAPWMAGEELTCDGGALAAALISGEEDIPVRLCVGLYHHTDAQVRARTMGEEPAPDDPAGWEDCLAEVEAHMMAEHHHWVVLWPGTDQTVLLDPNGPVRDEPYLHDLSGDAGLYGTGPRCSYEEIVAGEVRVLVYDPDDSWHDIAADLYPGLLDAVHQTR